MSNSGEYNNSAAGGPACSYAQLGHYNQGYGAGAMAPVPATTTSGVYVVPTYSAPGYNTLMHGKKVPGCFPYFGLQAAYGKGANNCKQTYVTKLCGGGAHHGAHHGGHHGGHHSGHHSGHHGGHHK